MELVEVNFDGMAGPTHNYSGLSLGNLASASHQGSPSNPKAAALQGLRKMWTLAELGLKQAVIPPHERPHLPSFQRLGYSRIGPEIDPDLLRAFSSSSGMWAANSASCAPCVDTEDGRLHLVPANLATKLHRQFESKFIRRFFKKALPQAVIHKPLPCHSDLSDEGAANQIRFCRSHGEPGVHLFVWGRSKEPGNYPKLYPARQTLEASRAVARLSRLPEERVLFAQQNPLLIDRGVFHNDVISTGNERLFFYYREAFVETEALIASIEKRLGEALCLIEVGPEELSLEEVLGSYLFNCQIATLPDKTMALITPRECEEIAPVKQLIEGLVRSSTNPLSQAVSVDLRQSMRNGGGPACLRLRLVLKKEELGKGLLTEELYRELCSLVERRYRDRLTPEDLADPELTNESLAALDELTQILDLGSLYEFQR